MKTQLLLFLALVCIGLVSAQPVTAAEGTPYTFETMPPEWTAYQGGSIEQSDLHYKHLTKSLKWNWVAGSSLRVTNPVGIATAPGMCYWIYNETPSTTPIKFNMYKKGVLLKSFNYDINFKGWRSFWYAFSGDGGIALANNPDVVEIKSTSATNTGTLFIDCVYFSSAINWERQNDFHIRVIKQSSQIADMVAIYNTPRPATTVLPTAAEQAGIDLIIQRWETFLMGSGKYAQNAQMIQKMSAVNSYINSCKSNATKYKIAKQPNGTVNGVGLFTTGFSPGFSEVHSSVIMGLALDARMKGNVASKQLALDFFDYYQDQGYAVGSGMGLFRYEPLMIEGLCHSLFLLRKELLADRGADSYQEKLKTLYWIAQCGDLFQANLTPGGNADDVRSVSVGLLAYSLMENDPAKRLQAVKAFKRFIENCLALTDGSGGVIKLDGSVFHHGFAYNSEYGTQALFQGALYYYLFHDTPFALSDQTYNNLKLALSNWNLHSSNLSYPLSTCGRFPGNGMSGMVAAYAFMALSKPEDAEMTAMAKRMCPLDNSAVITNFVIGYGTRITHTNSIGTLENMIEISESSTPKAAEPQASSYLPYTGMLLSRYKGWLVAIKGFSNFVVDYEAFKGNNYYGRYLSNDHIQIWNEGRKLNSYSGTSWDWCRFPGTTAKKMPADTLCFDADRGDKERNKSDDYFLGGTVLNDSVSMFANRLHDNANDKTFRAYKSNFIFANTIVSLGTNINNADAKYDTETTLFQLRQYGFVPLINGASWPASGTTALTGTTNTVLKNGWGNTYIVYPYGGGSLEIRRQTQTFKSENDATTASADYDVAYINHGKAPVNKGYRYITVLDGDAAKTALLAGANSPIQIVQQDNNAHIVYNSQLKTTAYAVYAPNATFATGIVASTVRPFVGMIKENSDGTVDIAVSDPDMNQVSGISSSVGLKLVLRGNFELLQGNPTLFFSKQTASATISQACKAGATYKIKLRNLDYTAVDKTTMSNVSFYPNPVTDQLVVTSSQMVEPLTLNLLDVNGRLLMAGLMTSGSNTFNTNQLSRGLYFLKIQDKNGAEIHKVIKK